jgi:hypothetical protein
VTPWARSVSTKASLDVMRVMFDSLPAGDLISGYCLSAALAAG